MRWQVTYPVQYRPHGMVQREERAKRIAEKNVVTRRGLRSVRGEMAREEEVRRT